MNSNINFIDKRSAFISIKITFSQLKLIVKNTYKNLLQKLIKSKKYK